MATMIENKEFSGNLMCWPYKIFFGFFLLVFVSPYYDFLYYVYNIRAVSHLFKIPMLGMFLVGVAFHFKKKIIFCFESILFTGFGIFCIGYGLLVNHKIDLAFISHIYAIVMPIVSISLGVHFAKDLNAYAQKYVIRCLWTGCLLVLGSLLLYYYFRHVKGLFGYFGFGTDIPLICAFLLTQKKYVMFICGLFLAVSSGKRSSVVVIIGITLFFLFKKLFLRFNLKKVLIWKKKALFALPLVMLLCWNGFQYAQDKDYFRRLRQITAIDYSDKLSVFYGTGGRLAEVTSVIQYFAEKPSRWLTGAGAGSKYPLLDPRYETSMEEFHYAHFSPISYVFLYGLPFMILLYLGFFRSLIKAIRYADNLFYLGFVALFLGSFFGSKLFIDPRVWFFYGMVKYFGGTRKGLIRTMKRKDI